MMATTPDDMMNHFDNNSDSVNEDEPKDSRHAPLPTRPTPDFVLVPPPKKDDDSSDEGFSPYTSDGDEDENTHRSTTLFSSQFGELDTGFNSEAAQLDDGTGYVVLSKPKSKPEPASTLVSGVLSASSTPPNSNHLNPEEFEKISKKTGTFKVWRPSPYDNRGRTTREFYPMADGKVSSSDSDSDAEWRLPNPFAALSHRDDDESSCRLFPSAHDLPTQVREKLKYVFRLFGLSKKDARSLANKLLPNDISEVKSLGEVLLKLANLVVMVGAVETSPVLFNASLYSALHTLDKGLTLAKSIDNENTFFEYSPYLAVALQIIATLYMYQQSPPERRPNWTAKIVSALQKLADAIRNGASFLSFSLITGFQALAVIKSFGHEGDKVLISDRLAAIVTGSCTASATGLTLLDIGQSIYGGSPPEQSRLWNDYLRGGHGIAYAKGWLILGLALVRILLASLQSWSTWGAAAIGMFVSFSIVTDTPAAFAIYMCVALAAGIYRGYLQGKRTSEWNLLDKLFDGTTTLLNYSLLVPQFFLRAFASPLETRLPEATIDVQGMLWPLLSLSVLVPEAARACEELYQLCYPYLQNLCPPKEANDNSVYASGSRPATFYASTSNQRSTSSTPLRLLSSQGYGTGSIQHIHNLDSTDSSGSSDYSP